MTVESPPISENELELPEELVPQLLDSSKEDLDAQSHVELEARLKGWVSADEWEAQGKDPKRHVDPQTFLERGREHPGMLRRQLDDMHLEIDRMQQAHAEALVDARQRAFAEAAAQITNDIQEARQNNDPVLLEVATQAGRHLVDQVDYESQVSPSTDPPQFDQAMLQFVENSKDWFQIDQEKTQLALALEEVLRRSGYSGSALYSELERRLNTPLQNSRALPAVEMNARSGRTQSNMAAQPVEVRRMFGSYWNTFKGDFKNRAEAEKKFLADMKDF